MKSISFILLSVFTFVGLSVAHPSMLKRSDDEICILSIVPCPEECPRTCVYPKLPCPKQYQPKCPNKKPHHRPAGHD